MPSCNNSRHSNQLLVLLIQVKLVQAHAAPDMSVFEMNMLYFHRHRSIYLMVVVLLALKSQPTKTLTPMDVLERSLV
eukprot:1430073-Amphidinium_carterae.1